MIFFNQVIKTFMTCENMEEEHWGRRGVGGKSQMGRYQPGESSEGTCKFKAQLEREERRDTKHPLRSGTMSVAQREREREGHEVHSGVLVK